MNTTMPDASELPSEQQPDTAPVDRATGVLLLLSVFVLAICGLIYELIAGTLSSYLLGDSVTQFSLVVGVFLSAMGAGSFLSKYFTGDLVRWFVIIELMIGLIGGSTGLAGFAAFTYTSVYVPVLYGMVAVVGMLIGMEIPLVIRILAENQPVKISVANVLALDYIGALIASVAFPFLLVPHLSLAQAGLMMGLANVLVAGLLLARLGRSIQKGRTGLFLAVGLAAVLLGVGMVFAGRMVSYMENRIYQDEVILSRSTPYQRLVITRWRDDVRMFLEGHLQFSSIDEYRYHEALVHPAMSAAAHRRNILILGGGDGLAVREVMKYSEVQRIDLVDIDPVVTDLFRTHPLLSTLNGGSLKSPLVHIHNRDALRYLENTDQHYDVILIDLPDPSEPALGKLYTGAFYRLASRRLNADGVLVTQATSPFRSREAFWCIVNTLEQAPLDPAGEKHFHVRPYHTVVPTFGTWGFAMASLRPITPATLPITVPTRYLSADILPTLFVFPTDMNRIDTPISRLDDPAVYRLYRRGLHRYL